MTTDSKPDHRQSLDPETYYKRDITQHAVRYTNAQLVELHAAGDTDAMATAFLPMVMAVAGRYARPTVEFMELVQAGNLGLLQAVDSWRPDRGAALSSWVYNYIRREIIEQARRELARDYTTLDAAYESSDEDDDGMGPAGVADTDAVLIFGQTIPSPDEAAAQDETAARVRAAVADLPQRQREAVELVKLAEYTYAEAAEAMGVSAPAVHQLVAKGLINLAKSRIN